MAVHIALLRAVNVGGTGKLAMSELRQLCEQAGFRGVRTYIQSGNVVLASALSLAAVKRKLERALTARMAKPVAVLVRSAPELAAALEQNPFTAADPKRVLILFLDRAPPAAALAGLAIPGREEVVLAGRELFVHFPDGIGSSKLKVPFADAGTGRNLNTVMKLSAMAQEMARG